MEILLDTNFIIRCVKENIDFDRIANEILSEKIKWIIPQQVLNELGNIKDNKEIKGKDKEAAKISFEILQKLDSEVVELGKSRNIDIAIINYILEKDIILATLDKGLKERVPNHKILTTKGKDYLQII